MPWFKGNLHMHSLWSDGYDFPEMITDWFKRHGYHFIAFTEHDQHQCGERWFACDPLTDAGKTVTEARLLDRYIERFGQSWVENRHRDQVMEVRLKELSEYRQLFEEPGRFLMFHGEEVTTSWGDGGRNDSHWINVFNTPRPIAPQHSSEGSAEAMTLTFAAAREAAQETGRSVLAFLDHPNYQWNAHAINIAATGGLRHIEIYTALNLCYSYGDRTHPSAQRIWDQALAMRLRTGGPIIYGLANDDCHTYVPHHQLGTTALPGRAWVMVRAASLSTEAIIDAINRGDFYSSTGPSLRRIEVDRAGFCIEVEPDECASYITRFIGARRSDGSNLAGVVLDMQEGVNPVYQFTGDELYVRAEVHSTQLLANPTVPGETATAWSQPVVPATFAMAQGGRHVPTGSA